MSEPERKRTPATTEPQKGGRFVDGEQVEGLDEAALESIELPRNPNADERAAEEA